MFSLFKNKKHLIVFLAVFFVYWAGFLMVDTVVHFRYVLNMVEKTFMHEYPRWGGTIFFLGITLPQILALVLLSLLSMRLFRKYDDSFIFSKLDAVLLKPVRTFLTAKEGITYEKELLRRSLWFLLAMCVFIGVYFALPLWFMGEGLFSARLVSGRLFVNLFVAVLCLYVYLNRKWVFGVLREFFLGSGNAYNLAIARIILFYFLYLIYQNRLQEAGFWLDMPRSAMVPPPLTGWYVNLLPVSGGLFRFLAYTGMVLSILAVLGVGTRWVMLLNIPVGLYVLGVPMFYGKLFHIHVWVWFPAIMAFSRCADVLSVDWLIRRWRKKAAPYPLSHAVYGVPIKFILLHFGIIYFFAGVIKIWDCGFDWALSDSPINQMQVEWVQHYNVLPDFRVDRYPWLVKLGSLGVIVFEIFFPFYVVSRKFRFPTLVAGLIFHNVVGYFMYIGFTDLQISYLLLINWAMIGYVLRRHKPAGLQVPLTKTWNVPGFKQIFVAGGIVFGLNFLCGVFRVHSWPFSSYPTYSMLVKDTHRYVHFDAVDENGTLLNVDSLGHAYNFRKESYTPIEDRIVENVRDSDSLTLNKNVTKLWKIWESGVPPLKRAVSVKAYLCESPVAPEKQHVLLHNEYLIIFNPRDI